MSNQEKQIRPVCLRYVHMHIELRGMYKTLKVFISVIKHDTDIIQVSLYSLNIQLSFDILHLRSNGRNWAFLIIN